VWTATRHAAAFETLEIESRHFEAQCQLCHTTGYGRPGGFSNLVRDRDLVDVQCEACHGPGARHAASPGDSYPTPPAPSLCLQCHDAENDPDFRFGRAWRGIAH
jgi:hypothetical protein